MQSPRRRQGCLSVRVAGSPLPSGGAGRSGRAASGVGLPAGPSWGWALHSRAPLARTAAQHWAAAREALPPAPAAVDASQPQRAAHRLSPELGCGRQRHGAARWTLTDLRNLPHTPNTAVPQRAAPSRSAEPPLLALPAGECSEMRSGTVHAACPGAQGGGQEPT